MGEFEFDVKDLVTKDDLHQLDDRLSGDIRINREKISKNSEDISELRTMYMSVAELPRTMASLEKTMVSVGNHLENIEENMKSMSDSIQNLKEENRAQNEKISQVDDKSKIDWATFITSNFWKIIIAIGGIYFILKDIFSSLI